MVLNYILVGCPCVNSHDGDVVVVDNDDDDDDSFCDDEGNDDNNARDVAVADGDNDD